MIITTQTARGFILLLLSSFIAGDALSVIYLFLVLLPPIISSGKNVRDGYKAFRERVKIYGNKFFDISSDVLICIIAACTISALVFIFNSGQFRFVAVAALCLGFFWSKYLLAGPLSSLFTMIAFILIKTLIFVSFPVVWLIRLISRAIGRIIAVSVNRRKLSLMKKYTKEQFDKLEALTEFGLVEQSYKELIK